MGFSDRDGEADVSRKRGGRSVALRTDLERAGAGGEAWVEAQEADRSRAKRTSPLPWRGSR